MQLVQYTTHSSALVGMQTLTCNGTSSWAAVLKLGDKFYAADAAGINHLQEQGHDPDILEEREETWLTVDGRRHRMVTKEFVTDFVATMRQRAPRIKVYTQEHRVARPCGNIKGCAITEHFQVKLYWVRDVHRRIDLGYVRDPETSWSAVGRAGLVSNSLTSPERAVAQLRAREELLMMKSQQPLIGAPEGAQGEA